MTEILESEIDKISMDLTLGCCNNLSREHPGSKLRQHAAHKLTTTRA